MEVERQHQNAVDTKKKAEQADANLDKIVEFLRKWLKRKACCY